MASPEAPHDESAAVSDAEMKAGTGKTSGEWFRLLDQRGAETLDRLGIMRIMSAQHGIGSWWRQLIAVAYEQARNLRQIGERSVELGASASRTINAPVRALYEAVTDAATRSTWLKARFEQLEKALDKRAANDVPAASCAVSPHGRGGPFVADAWAKPD